MANAGSICPRYHHAVELIGRRWTGALLSGLLNGSARFIELRAIVPEISDRMLTERLRELEIEGVITRTVFPDTPVRIEYELTAKGRALEGAIVAIGDWATRWVTETDLERKSSAEPATTPARSARTTGSGPRKRRSARAAARGRGKGRG